MWWVSRTIFSILAYLYHIIIPNHCFFIPKFIVFSNCPYRSILIFTSRIITLHLIKVIARRKMIFSHFWMTLACFFLYWDLTNFSSDILSGIIRHQRYRFLTKFSLSIFRVMSWLYLLVWLSYYSLRICSICKWFRLYESNSISANLHKSHHSNRPPFIHPMITKAFSFAYIFLYSKLFSNLSFAISQRSPWSNLPVASSYTPNSFLTILLFKI